MQDAGYKPCSKCKRVLPLASFSPHPRLRLGRRSWCRECANTHTATRRRAKSVERARQRAEDAPTRAAEAIAIAEARAAAIPDSFGHWLAGFIDGEGCFDICARGDTNARRYSLRLTLVLRADDHAVLDRIRATTGVGVARPKVQQSGLGSRRRQYGWFVVRKSDVLTIVALLDRCPLQSKKVRDYAIWREAALVWGTTSYTYKLGERGRAMHDCWARLGQFKAELMAARAFVDE